MKIPFPDKPNTIYHGGFCDSLDQLMYKWVFTDAFEYEELKTVVANMSKYDMVDTALTYPFRCRMIDASMHNFYSMRKHVKRWDYENYKSGRIN